MEEIRQARENVSHSDVRTELESITASLREMLDSAAGERTVGDVAFADSDFPGASPDPDDLRELEKNLRKLAANTDREDVRTHLESAQRKLSLYRNEREEHED